jgi:hypothetical protein
MRKYIFIVPIAIVSACLPLLSMGQSVFSISIAGYDAKCNGSLNGSAKVTPAGGVAPYSYMWALAADTTDSIGGLAAGMYPVTVTDSAGDTISGSITITQPASLTVIIDSDVVPPCFRVTGGVCGCENTLWAVVTGGTPPYSYLWSPGSSSTGSTSTDDTLMYACYLEFTVSVTDSNNCMATDSLNVVVPYTDPVVSTTGIGQVSSSNGINTYPNPASDRLNISMGTSAAGINNLAVYDMLGAEVFEQKLSGNERLITIDVSGFAEGDYLLKATGSQLQKSIHFSVLR